MLNRSFFTRSVILALPIVLAAGCTQLSENDSAKVSTASEQALEAKQMAQDALSQIVALRKDVNDQISALRKEVNEAKAAAEQAAAEAKAAADKADRIFQKSTHK
jgi:hypothetical protein